MHTSPSWCRLASGAVPLAGQASSLRTLRTLSAAPSRSPPQHAHKPAPLGGPACSCPGWRPATMPQSVDPIHLCTLHRLPDRPLLLRFRIGWLGKDMLHPAFYARWAQMPAWTVYIGCLVRACSRERAYPPDRGRLSLPLLEGPPLMDPLDVTHGMLRCWRTGVWGGLSAGAPARFRR